MSLIYFYILSFIMINDQQFKHSNCEFCRAIKECLAVTENLTTLVFEGIPLRERDLTCLAKVQEVISEKIVNKFFTRSSAHADQ